MNAGPAEDVAAGGTDVDVIKLSDFVIGAGEILASVFDPKEDLKA